ncbi:MAG: Trp family transcriptional regulator [Desulforegulaceae bacterium]|nr:Trp family transcriptional regulator [Desulforegulaceae bacterium]
MSKRTIDEKAFEELAEVFCQINDKNEMKVFIEEILTGKECFDLVMRWKLLKAIYKGQTQRKIAQNYKISLCRITRGSKILKKKDSVVKNILDNFNFED